MRRHVQMPKIALSCLAALGVAALGGAPGAAAAPCPNEALRAEQHATFLPDCRAYEMVSPVDKNGNDVMVDTGRVRLSASESPGLPRAATFGSLGGFADVRGTGVAVDYMAQRTAVPGTQGWSTHALTPPQQPANFFEASNGLDSLYINEADPELSRLVFLARNPVLPGAAPNVEAVPNLYLRGDLRSPGLGSYQLLSDASAPLTLPPGTPSPLRLPKIAASTADLSRVLFQSIFPLTADAPSGTNVSKLYVASADGSVRLVGQVPASGSSCTGVACQAAPWAVAGQGTGDTNYLFTPHVLSTDGSRAFFTVGVSGALGNKGSAEGDLYLRDEQGTASVADDTSTQLNVSERTVPAAAKPAMYWDAADDGSVAFFTSQEALTDDATVNGFPKLYRWSLAPDGQGDHLRLLSADLEPADTENEVFGVVGVSADGDTAYFIQRGQIVAGQPLIKELGNGTSPGVGIYVWREGEGVSYVGQMVDVPYDVIDVLSGAQHSVSSFPHQQSAKVSADGQRLLISLRRPPWPGAADHGNCIGQKEGGLETESNPGESIKGCRQLYLYDAESGQHPRCVSCDPDGTPPHRGDFWGARTGNGAALFGLHQNSPVNPDFTSVYFTSAAALVDADTNGVYDAYRWQMAGSGECESDEANEGCLRLLSSGTSPDPSYYLEASPDGSDVLIATREPLVGWDVDHAMDVYDLRVGGGFPEPPPAPAECVGDGCRAGAGAAPAAAGAASATVNGPGDRIPDRKKPCRRNGKGAKAAKSKAGRRCAKPHRGKAGKRGKKSKRTNSERRAGR